MHGSATSIAPWNVALVIVINYPLCGAFSKVVNGLDQEYQLFVSCDSSGENSL